MEVEQRDVTIRILVENNDGSWEDTQMDYGLETFAGFLPNVGDIILEPGVLSGLDRSDPRNRRLLTVKHRIFNANDLPDYVALLVRSEVPLAKQEAVIP